MKALSFITLLFFTSLGFSQETITISGYVKDSQEELLYAKIYIEELNAIHAGVRASQGSFSLPFDGWLYKNTTKISIEQEVNPFLRSHVEQVSISAAKRLDQEVASSIEDKFAQIRRAKDSF